MEKTPKGFRLHIGVFGRRNVGKSSVLNALTRQNVSIVSEVAGTTTDPVEKVMEFKPIGPVVFIDTAGIDDVGGIGKARIEKTMAVCDRTELAVLVTDDWQEYEQQLVDLFRKRKLPFIVIANKSDIRTQGQLEQIARDNDCPSIVTASAARSEGMDQLRQALIDTCPAEFLESATIFGDLVKSGDLTVLVTPIDIEAPKGRLILPQVQSLREILDRDAYSIVVKEHQLADALSILKRKPSLVVTDSQAFTKICEVTPDDIPMTGFSILFARLKGDLSEMVKGALAIDSLQNGDKVLIAEACTHHPMTDDIGREKIPNWLTKRTGANLQFDIVAGRDYPKDLDGYKLIIHCGACVFNRQLMLSRIQYAKIAGIPITNYGLCIAFSLGLFERALRPFPEVYDIYRSYADNSK